jgi:CBS domain-containing protein
MIELTERQLEIVAVVERHAPITGEQIAEMLHVSRPTIRSDLSLLVMLGYLDAKPKVGYFLGTASRSGDPASVSRLLDKKVKDVQGRPVMIRETATIHDAVVALFLENVGSLIVTDEDGLLAGIVSRKDLLKVTLGNPAASSMPVSLIMTRQPNIVTAAPDDTVWEAARRMIRHEVDALPVVVPAARQHAPEALEVVGRITKTTMTRLLLELASGAGE